jgi:hypothetical protein
MAEANNQADRCAVCGKDVAGKWFARLRRGDEWVKVCSPACSIRYSEGSAADSEVGRASAPGERRQHFVFNGELWS